MTLSRQTVRTAQQFSWDRVSSENIDKVKIAFLDMLSCAYESLDLPQSVQAIQIASRSGRGCSSIIGTGLRTSPSEAAFVNGVLGHGLVREDMHTGSVSHLGVVIFPTLLALAQTHKVSGRDFILGAICGYETGSAMGRALMDQENVRMFRPTGITGPLGGAVGACKMLGLSEDASVSALGFAANTTVGLNEWPRVGADEMFFHVGYAARNAVTAVELAELGAYASETALDGAAGLFAALRRADKAGSVRLFARDRPEILEVYHKPAPACNYAQTGCQAALALAKDGVKSADIASILVRCTAAAINYPGCNSQGPFERILQAKMSIHFCVAATLTRGSIEESNYRLLRDPEITRLIQSTRLEEDADLTAAYPGQQGSEVIVTLRDGRTISRRLPDVIPATPDQIRTRFRIAAGSLADPIEDRVDRLESLDDAGAIGSLLMKS